MSHFARPNPVKPGTCIECGLPAAPAPQGPYRHVDELEAQAKAVAADHAAGKHGDTERHAQMYANFGCSACIEREWH